MNSKIISADSLPQIEVDGKIINSSSYLTYFTENARYDDFAKAGFELYSVCAYFTSLPINEASGFTAARMGIFDKKGDPDFSEFDADMDQLIKIKPDAMIFPRIYISMPLWWIRENPKECIETDLTPEGRELLFSEKFISDADDMLKCFIDHIGSMPYAENIIGYQISGGTTQEWFHFDRRSDFCENAFPYFAKYMAEKNISVDKDSYISRKYLSEYMDFLNDSVAETVEHFAKLTKELSDFRQIVGTFYGYSIEVPSPLFGTHSLSKIIESPYIDFYSSPVSYIGGRKLGSDWVSMLPEESLKLHNKMYFVEADIRTHLSKFPDECRKDITISVPYRQAIWLGGPTEELSVYQIRKAFAKILTHSHAFWWFDMWGGWYQSEKLMAEIKRMKDIFDMPIYQNIPSSMKAAVIIDETMYRRFPKDLRQHDFCSKLSESGIAYDLFLLSDLDRLSGEYPLIFLPFPNSAEISKKYSHLDKIKFACNDLSLESIRLAAKENKVHIFSYTNDILYAGNGFAAIHAKSGGRKQISLPFDAKPTSLFGHKFTYSDNNLIFDMNESDTVLFKL